MPTTISIAGGQTVGVDAELKTGIIKASISALKISVSEFKYDIGGLRGVYSGATGQSVTDNDTSYVYLDNSASLQINTTGFPSELHIPLGRVVAVNGEVLEIYDERVLMASSAALQSTCRIGYPVDGGIRGGGTSASSNNDMPAIKYDYDAYGWNRWVGRPPQNYVSGDLTMRLYVTVPSSPSNGTGTRWTLEWAFRSVDDDLGDWDNSDTVIYSFDGSDIADDLWVMDFTLPSGAFDKDADLMFFKLTRKATDPDDDCGKYVYVHAQELRYVGYTLAGQAGQ